MFISPVAPPFLILTPISTQTTPLAALILTLTFLTACTAGKAPPQTSFSVGYGQDDMFFIPTALQATADAFFTPAASTSTAAAGGGSVDIDKDTLSPNSNTAYQSEHSRQLRLGARLEQPLGGHFSLGAGAALTYGKSRYLLPKGAGILKDPITIRFTSRGLELDTGLIWQKQHSRRVSSRYEMGIGGSVAQTRTQIDSALLDIESRSTHSAGFIYTDIGLGLHPKSDTPPSLRLRTRLKYYPDIGLSLQTSLSTAF